MARVENHGSAKPIKAALYLDFDNVFLALQRLDKKAAHRFAKEPLSWLKWFEDGGHEMTIATSENAEERRILVRRCYLNPSAFSRYRPYFTRNGFMVIDCPALTSQGKNSADIYMVMDILDALSHETRFDEFIILSSDADFTPILTRLREHDRRSTIISNAMAAAALKSACDYAVPENTFIEEALEPETIEQASAPPQDNRVARRGAPSAGRVAPSESEPGTQPKLMTDGSSATLVSQVVQFARGSLERSSRPVLVSTLGHHLSSAVRNALRENKYCGHRSLTRLLKTADGDRMSTVVAGPESYVYDPTRHQPLPTRTEQEIFRPIW